MGEPQAMVNRLAFSRDGLAYVAVKSKRRELGRVTHIWNFRNVVAFCQIDGRGNLAGIELMKLSARL